MKQRTFPHFSRLIFALCATMVIISRPGLLLSLPVHNANALNTLSDLVTAGPFDYYRGSCTCPRLAQNTSLNDVGDAIDTRPMLDIGRAYFYRQEYSEAILALEQVRFEGADRRLADYYSGAAYVCSENGAGAADYWKEDNLIWLVFKGIYECNRVGRESRSQTLYDLALKAKPVLLEGWQMSKPGPAHYLAAATVVRERGETSLELRWLQMAQEKFPDSLLGNFALGEYHERSGDYARAAHFYRQALINSPPDDISVYQHFIRASFAEGAWADGIAAAETLLLELRPDSASDWRIFSGIVRKHPNSGLCVHVNRMLLKVERPESAESEEYIAALETWCTDH